MEGDVVKNKLNALRIFLIFAIIFTVIGIAHANNIFLMKSTLLPGNKDLKNEKTLSNKNAFTKIKNNTKSLSAREKTLGQKNESSVPDSKSQPSAFIEASKPQKK